MRPTEKASETTYIETSCPECVFAVTVYPPVKIKERTWDGGYITLATLSAHHEDIDSWRARFRRAWKAWHGCPDTSLCIEEEKDLEAIIRAIRAAKPKAFPWWKEKRDETSC